MKDSLDVVKKGIRKHVVPKKVYIVDGARTPFLKMQAQRGRFSASDLALQAGRALLERQSFAPDIIDEVVLGCVMPSENEANIARIVSLRLGCGEKTPAWTVQRNCASGMQALDCAYKDIALGRAEIVLAGGTEAMSHAPLLLRPGMIDWLSRWQRCRSLSEKYSVLKTQ